MFGIAAIALYSWTIVVPQITTYTCEINDYELMGTGVLTVSYTDETKETHIIQKDDVGTIITDIITEKTECLKMPDDSLTSCYTNVSDANTKEELALITADNTDTNISAFFLVREESPNNGIVQSGECSKDIKLLK